VLGVSGDGRGEPCWAGWRGGALRGKDCGFRQAPQPKPAGFDPQTRKRRSARANAEPQKIFLLLRTKQKQKKYRRGKRARSARR
jgi:hypothetical protein